MSDRTSVDDALGDERVMTLLLVGALGSGTASLPVNLGARIETRMVAMDMAELAKGKTIPLSSYQPSYAQALPATAGLTLCPVPRSKNGHYAQAAVLGCVVGAALAILGLPALGELRIARELGVDAGSASGQRAAGTAMSGCR